MSPQSELHKATFAHIHRAHSQFPTPFKLSSPAVGYSGTSEIEMATATFESKLHARVGDVTHLKMTPPFQHQSSGTATTCSKSRSERKLNATQIKKTAQL